MRENRASSRMVHVERGDGRAKPPRLWLITFQLAVVRSLCPMLQNAASERCADRVRISEAMGTLVNLGQV